MGRDEQGFGEVMVRITWRDAYFDLDETTQREDFIVTTMGYLVPGLPRFVHIASEKTPEGFRAMTHIPVENIIDREVLWTAPAERKLKATTTSTS